MKKKIVITEEQLKMLKELGDDFSSLHKSIGDYMASNSAGFQDERELLSSISIRLSNAIKMKNWGDVNDVNMDIKSFMDKTYKSKEDIAPEIGDQSSVMDDTPEEKDERNYGINESIQKLKSDFKRLV